MNTQIVAVIIAEGTKLLGQLMRNRPIRIETVQSTPDSEQAASVTIAEDSPPSNPATNEIATGCVPCAVGHFGTCSGLLNEAMRFARDDGLESNEVIKRTGLCLVELNTMERVDLRPELTIELPVWEKELADEVLIASRHTRHQLEDLKSVKQLEEIAATTQSTQGHIWREYTLRRLKNRTPEDEANIQKRVLEKIDEIVEAETEEIENE